MWGGNHLLDCLKLIFSEALSLYFEYLILWIARLKLFHSSEVNGSLDCFFFLYFVVRGVYHVDGMDEKSMEQLAYIFVLH